MSPWISSCRRSSGRMPASPIRCYSSTVKRCRVSSSLMRRLLLYEVRDVDGEVRKRVRGDALAAPEDPHATVAVTQGLATDLEPLGGQIEQPDLLQPDPRVERNLDAA